MKFKCRACGQTIQITKRGAISIHKPPKEVAERYNIGRRKLWVKYTGGWRHDIVWLWRTLSRNYSQVPHLYELSKQFLKGVFTGFPTRQIWVSSSFGYGVSSLIYMAAMLLYVKSWGVVP